MDVSIIIVNYNTLELTKECIDSIINQTKDVTYEIILVDNASSDGSKAFFEKYRTEIIYIYNNSNIGFGAANNVGMKIAKGNYVFCLNSDTLFINNALKYFVDFSKNNGDNFVLGSWLLDSEKKISHSYGKFPSPFEEIRTSLRVYTSRIPWIKMFCTNKEPYSCNPLSVDYITGADLFIPKVILNEVGLFDENFFMYCEETDLQKRIDKAGYKRIIINGPMIVHLEQGSQKQTQVVAQKNANKMIVSTRSMLYYQRKYCNRYSYFMFKYTYLMFRFLPMLLNEYSFKDKKKFFKIFF